MEEKILEIIKEITRNNSVDENSCLVEEGILDSMAIASLISELSLEFSVHIPYEEIKEENFNSVGAIEALVKKLVK